MSDNSNRNNFCLLLSPVGYWVLVFAFMFVLNPGLGDAWNILWLFACVGAPFLIVCVCLAQWVVFEKPFATWIVFAFSIGIMTIGAYLLVATVPHIGYGR